jgi:hypothetical protein
MLSAVALLALVATAPTSVTSSIGRVRPLSDGARALLSEAATRSPTVARLLREIETSDAVVYIDLQFDMRSEGATTLLASNSQCRFLRILISRLLPYFRRIEMLGHELHHALEIIHATDVRDPPGVRRLYTQIGWVLNEASFESKDAIDTERQVRRELMGMPLRR